MKYFVPEEVFSKVDFPVKDGKTAENKNSKSPAAKKSSEKVSRPGITAWNPPSVKKADFPARSAVVSPAPGAVSVPADPLLQKSILARPEDSVYILRHWYWEKTPEVKELWQSVPAHDRIFIIIASLGEKIAGLLLPIMTPTEQKQLSDISKKNIQFPREVIAAVKAHFLSLLNN